ncbi:MAG TPA: 6-pyruvoyl-tetrahydropterin synthase-related protein [Blastocatellia bacterium]|nr:6-pyruvoyl-tetrahydropterin synthase-related protein [Blastocatellia bacterium]
MLTSARLASPGFGPQGDLPVHYHLTRAFVQGLRDGDWLPRWAGVLDGGRGDAVFTFYAPLFYWLSGGMTVMTGLHILTTFKVLLFAIFVMAQLSAYLLAREFFGVRAGILAALVYVTLPAYPHLVLHRGFLPNGLALSLMPLAVLGAYRLLTTEAGADNGWRAKSMALFSLSSGAIILVHPITTYLCAWTIFFLTLCCWPQAGWRGIRNLATGVMLSLSLTAFFLVPQIIEMKWVQTELEVTQQHYRSYFLFAEAADESRYRQGWAGLNQVVSVMTLLQTALAGLLLISSYRMLRQTNRISLWRWLLVLSVTGLFISLPASDFIWRWLPGLKFIQFPWRFQPFVSLATGLLAAATIEGWTKNGRRLRTLLAAVATWLVLASLAFTFLVARPQMRQLSRDDVRNLLHPKDALPLSSQQVNELRERDDLSHLAYVANQIPFRPAGADLMLYPPATQPGGISIIAGKGKVSGQELNNSHRRFSLVNDEPVRVRIETYFYPNWVARIDGQQVPISVEPGSGLMLIDVPSGNHSLSLTCEVTRSTERWARLISVAALLILIVLTRN